MPMKSENIYALPGWGFDAAIFNELNCHKLNFIGLDYLRCRTLSSDKLTTKIATRIPENSTLLGWSFGGMFAIKLAAQHPTKVRKLILISSQPKLCADDEWCGLHKTDAEQFIENFTKSPSQQMQYFVKLVCYPSRITTARQMIQPHIMKQNVEVLAHFLKLLFSQDLRDEYRELKTDVLNIICRQDAVLRQSANQLKELNPKAETVTIEDGGHADFLISPKKYLKIIEKFISHD